MSWNEDPWEMKQFSSNLRQNHTEPGQYCSLWTRIFPTQVLNSVNISTDKNSLETWESQNTDTSSTLVANLKSFTLSESEQESDIAFTWILQNFNVPFIHSGGTDEKKNVALSQCKYSLWNNPNIPQYSNKQVCVSIYSEICNLPCDFKNQCGHSLLFLTLCYNNEHCSQIYRLVHEISIIESRISNLRDTIWKIPTLLLYQWR